MKFGQILKELRAEHKITQIALAKALNVTDTAVRNWENRNSEPNYNTLCKIAKYFDVTVGQLIGSEDFEN